MSPMATIVKVVRNKTMSSMHCNMGVVNVFNSFCWGTYDALIDNIFILGPNMIDFYLDHMRIKTTNGQLKLFWECNPSPPAKEKLTPVRAMGPSVGLTRGCIQLVLTFIYRPKAIDLIEGVDDEGSFSVVVFSPDQQPKSMSSSTEFVAEHLLR
ncbi:SWEET sugar transporter [Phytophthora cactorum]|nr:SWEET sugar transporter [Phytophthora cactorum]